jgi:hypothetical protein
MIDSASLAGKVCLSASSSRSSASFHSVACTAGFAGRDFPGLLAGRLVTNRPLLVFIGVFLSQKTSESSVINASEMS